MMNNFRFGIISSIIVFIYATNIQKVDPEEYGGISEIIKEGFMTAFATFLVRTISFSIRFVCFLFQIFERLFLFNICFRCLGLSYIQPSIIRKHPCLIPKFDECGLLLFCPFFIHSFCCFVI